jgi:hypothetical protein
MNIKITFFLYLVLLANFVHAQDYFRISVDFTTKTKPAEGKANLTKRKIFYDKYTKELIYDIHFPEKEKWVVQDSRIYKLVNDSIYFTEEIPSLNEFTVFHLSLNSNLNYFGLAKAGYSVGKIDKAGELTVTYWNIPQQVQEFISSIAVARKDNSLHSVVISDESGRINNKQFFDNYIRKGGFEFPGRIVQIFYDENQRESYQVMEFENIVLNDTENEKNYHYKLDQ